MSWQTEHVFSCLPRGRERTILVAVSSRLFIIISYSFIPPVEHRHLKYLLDMSSTGQTVRSAMTQTCIVPPGKFLNVVARLRAHITSNPDIFATTNGPQPHQILTHVTELGPAYHRRELVVMSWWDGQQRATRASSIGGIRQGPPSLGFEVTAIARVHGLQKLVIPADLEPTAATISIALDAAGRDASSQRFCYIVTVIAADIQRQWTAQNATYRFPGNLI